MWHCPLELSIKMALKENGTMKMAFEVIDMLARVMHD